MPLDPRFATTPALARQLAPIAQQQAQADQDATAIQQDMQRQQAAQQREAERQQAQAAKDALTAANVATEARMRQQDRPFWTGADGVIRPTHSDAEWQQQQAARKQAESTKLQYQQEGRKFTTDGAGRVIPLESDAVLAQRRQQEAEGIRRASLDREIQALEADLNYKTTAQGLRPLSATARKNLTKQLQDARFQATNALLPKLQEKAKAVTGGADWVPFNEAPAPEAQAAQERLARLQQPDADLEEDDLADLEADAATAPTAKKLRTVRDLLLRADEADKVQADYATRLADLKLRRDAPDKWEAAQREKLAKLTTPEEVDAYLQSADADLEPRLAAFEQQAAALQAEAGQWQQKADDLAQRNAQTRLSGIPASELVTLSDGETWHAPLYQEMTALQAQQQASAGEFEQRRRSLMAQQEGLQKQIALRNEAAQKAQAAAQTRQQTQRHTLRFTPGYEQAAADMDSLDQEAAARTAVVAEMFPQDGPQRQAAMQAIEADIGQRAQQAQAQGQQRAAAASAAYLGIQTRLRQDPKLNAVAGDLWVEARKNLAQALGVSEQEADGLLQDQESQDWSSVQGKHGEAIPQGNAAQRFMREAAGDKRQFRVLKNGGLIINPQITDPAAYKAAVEASPASPEAKAAAMARQPDLRQRYGAQALETLEAIGDAGWPAFRAAQKDATPEEAAARYADKLKADTGTGGKIARQIFQSMNQGVGDIGAQALGLLSGITGSETLMKGAQALQERAALIEADKQLRGVGGNFALDTLGQFSRLIPSIAPAAAGARAGTAALALLGRTSVGARLLPALSSALRTARTPADAARAAQQLMQGAGLAGAAAAGGAQTYGAQIADIYTTLRREHPEMDHSTALRQAQLPALLSGAVTALLTVAGGSTGVERLLTNPAAAKEAFRKAYSSQLQRAGAIGKAVATGGLKELPEEIGDELFSTVASAVGTGQSVPQALAQFVDSLPELAGAIFALGGLGEGVSTFRETSAADVTQPAPAAQAAGGTPPETLAAAEAEIDAFQMEGLSESAAAQTQATARALLYIAQGDIADLPDADLALVGVSRGADGTLENLDTSADGKPPRVKIEQGQPIITQPTLDALAQALPTVRAAIPLDEAARRAQLSPAAAADGTGPDTAAGEAGASGSPETAAPRGSSGQGPAPETAQDSGGTPQAAAPAVSGAAAAPPAAASSFEDGSAEQVRSQQLAAHLESLGLPPDQAQTAADALVRRRGIIGGSYMEHAVDKTFREDLKALGITGSFNSQQAQTNPLRAGADLAARAAALSQNPASQNPAKPQEAPAAQTKSAPQEAPPPAFDSDAYVTARRAAMQATPPAQRKAAIKLLGALDRALTRYAPAFTAVTFSSHGIGGGLVTLPGQTLDIDLTRWLQQNAVPVEKAGPAAQAGVEEELIHRAATSLFTPQDMRTFWRSLPADLQALVYRGYHAVDIIDTANRAQYLARYFRAAGLSSDQAAIAADAIVKKRGTAIHTWEEHVKAPSFQEDLAALGITGFNIKNPRLTPPQDLAARAAALAEEKHPTWMPSDPPARWSEDQAFYLPHEFLRMLVQDKVFKGRVSEAISADARLGAKIIAFLQRMVDQLRRLIDQVPTDLRVEIGEYERRLTNEVNRLLKALPDPLRAKEATAAAPLTQTADNRASVLAPGGAPATEAPPSSFAPVLGATGTAYTDANDPIEYQWAVVDVTSLNLSNRDDGSINPAYPQELQPRDRTSAGSEAQVADIARNFNLDRLSTSSTIADGAPIIGPDGVVESGNGRGMGGRRAYTSGAPSASSYRDALIRRAAEFGLNQEQVEAVPNPMLVRIRRTEVNRLAFVLSANVSTLAPKREIEQAKIDAKQIVPDLFDTFVPSEDGEIFTLANADFIRGFIAAIVPPAERPAVIDKAGNLSQTGLRRLRAALFVHAYGGSPEALNALQRLTESVDAGDTHIARALLTLAPRFAEQKARIASGALYPLDLTQDLTQALQTLSDLKNRGEKVADWLAQDRIPGIGDDPGPLVTRLVQDLHTYRQRPRQLIEALDRYARAVDAAGDPRQMSMFGDEKPDALTLWTLASKDREPALAKGTSQPQAGIPPATALKLYRKLTKQQQETGSLPPGQAQALERAERSLGQLFLFDDASTSVLKPAEDLVLEQQTTGQPRPRAEQLPLFTGSKAPDPRLLEKFGPDWPHGWDDDGFPNMPVTLPDGHPLLQPTHEKATATLQDDHPLVAAGMLPAGSAVPRSVLQDALVAFFFRGKSPVPAGTQPTVYAMGGGGGAGKSTILRLLADSGRVNPGAVEVNADAIKELIPEYAEIKQAGDGRAAATVHEESSQVAKRVLARLLDPGQPRYHVIYDATLGHRASALPHFARWKAAGMRIHLIGVTIDPQEAAMRAVLRGSDEGRWVPMPMLWQAHKGFNAALKEYIALADFADIFDNTARVPQIVAQKSGSQEQVSIENPALWAIVDRRKDHDAKRPGQEISNDLGNPEGRGETPLREVQSQGQGSRGPDSGQTPEVRPPLSAYLDAALANLRATSRTAAGILDTSASAGKAAQMATTDGAAAAQAAVKNFTRAIEVAYQVGRRPAATPESLQNYMDATARLINRGITAEGVLLRDSDSAKYPYTRIADLPAARAQFAADLHRRLNDPGADPVETAAWVHWRLNFTDHPYADGVGKTTEVIAAWVLMQAGQPLPVMPADRKAWFASAYKGPPPSPQRPDSYLPGWPEFSAYYRSLIPGAPPLATGRKSVRQSMEDWNRDPANGTTIASNYRGGNAWLSPDRRFFHNQEHHYMLPDDVDYTAAMKAGFIRLRPETTPSDGSKTLWVEFYPPLAAQTRALIEDQAAERGMDDVYFDPDRTQTLAMGRRRVADTGTPDLFSSISSASQAQPAVDRFQAAYGENATLLYPFSFAGRTQEVPVRVWNKIPSPAGRPIQAAEISRIGNAVYRFSIVDAGNGSYSQVEKFRISEGFPNDLGGSFDELSSAEIDANRILDDRARRLWESVQNTRDQLSLFKGRSAVDDTPDLFSFNNGLQLDTLLTPAQRQAKVQQAQQLDLFADLDPTPPSNARPRSTSPRAPRPARPSRPAEPAQTAPGLGDLFGQTGMAPAAGGDRPLDGELPGLAGGSGGGGADAAGGGTTRQPGADTGSDFDSQNPADSGMPGLPGDAGNLDAGPNRPPVGDPARNFEVPDNVESLAPATDKAKILANIEAIRLLKQLEDERRDATPEEKTKLAAYTGWGAFKEAFNSKYEEDISTIWDKPNARRQFMPDWLQSWERNHRPLHKLLKENMTEDEFASASASTLNAHYTAAPIIRAMWKMVERLGFTGGRALEPSAGAGHYLGLTPAAIADKTQWQTVELDDLSARLLSKLYPEATVNEERGGMEGRQVSGLGFERARIPNGSLDLIISNVPFHESGPKKKGFPNLNLHNFFFAHALDKVKPGGLVAFITSESTMQNNVKQRDFIASKGDLVAAFRLPNNAFKGNAGTEVTTDIIILRKPDGKPFQGKAWRNLVEVGRQTITLTQGKDQTADELRREAERTGQIVGREYWKDGKKAIDVSAPIMVNEYFVNHPQHAIGTHTLASTMYRAGGYALVAPDGLDVPAALDALIPTLPANIVNASSVDAAPEVVLANRDDKPFSFKEQDGKIYEVQDDGSMEEAEWSTNPEMVKTWRSWKRVSNAIEELVSAENSDGASDDTIADLRRRLNLAYDTHIATHRAVSMRGNGNKHRHLRSDPGYPLTAALEEEVTTVDPKTGKKTYTYKKAEIFTKRIGRPIVLPTKASNVDEALELSLAWKGHIDPAYGASLLGSTVERFELEALQRPDIFRNPATGTLEQGEEYLSGNVRQKLEAAQEAAQDDPTYQKNVEALLTAQPERKEIARISPVLGARWIPAPVYDAFIKEVLQGNDTVEYIPAGNSWIISGSGVYSTEEHGTERAGPFTLFKHALNMTEPLIYDGSGENRTLNPSATAAARSALDKMRRAFIDFVKTSDVQVTVDEQSIPVWQATEDAFNETNNSYVTPKHTGAYLKFPGLNTDYVYTKAHRRSVIARFLTTRRGMMAHGVGSGKTFNQIILAQELRRLGLAKKPMIVVQNSTLGQFAKSYLKAYPGAKILVPSKADFQAQNRRKLVAKIATGNWDAIILPHSQFDLISNKESAVKAYMDSQIDELMAIVNSTKDKAKVRDLEGMIKRLRDRRQGMLDQLKARQDTAVMWEDLGIDALIMDEAHNYKSLPIITRMGRVKGVPASGNSQRAINFMLKCRDVQARTGGKNIFLATGTPIKNSMAEAYIMMQFMAPDILEEFHIHNFDDFATTYGQTVTEAEMAWGGTPKMETRFAKFQNGGALMTMIRTMFDVAFGNANLGLDVPRIKGGEPEMVIVKATPAVDQFNAWVRNVAQLWKEADAKEKEEYTAVPIQTMAAGIAAALDPRLLAPTLPDDPGSKVNEAIRRVTAIYKAGMNKKTTQIIFSDLRNPFSMDYLMPFTGHPFPDQGSTGEFDLYEDIQRKLIASGIPAKEIHLMKSGMTDTAKAALFEKVDAGEIRIIIGSTELLGVGVNIQTRLKAVHHLMPPRDFTPAMMEQRNGRIIRQGNLHAEKVEGKPAWNEEVEVVNYGTEGSMDSAIYGTLARKQRFITQLLMGEEQQDTFDDPTDPVAVNMAEMAARTLGDPDFIRRIELEKEIKDLRLQNEAFTNELSGKRSRLSRLEALLRNGPADLEGLRKEADRVAKLWKRTAPRPEGVREETDISDKPVYEFGGMTIDTAAKDGAITNRLGTWLLDQSKNAERSGRPFTLAELKINGQPVKLRIDITLPGTATGGGILGPQGSAVETFSGPDSLIQKLRRLPAAAQEQIERTQRQLDQDALSARNLRSLLASAPSVFPEAERLASLEREAQEVDARLRTKAGPPEAPQGPDNDRDKQIVLPPLKKPEPGLMTYDVEQVIDNANIIGNKLFLPDTLDRKLFQAVNAALESAGGRWSRKDKAHLFAGDPRPYLGLAEMPTAEASSDVAIMNAIREGKPVSASKADQWGIAIPKNYRYDAATDAYVVNAAAPATILATATRVPQFMEGLSEAEDWDFTPQEESQWQPDLDTQTGYIMPASARALSLAPREQLTLLGRLMRAIAAQPGSWKLSRLTPARAAADTLEKAAAAYGVPVVRIAREIQDSQPVQVIYVQPPRSWGAGAQERRTFEITQVSPGRHSVNSLMGAGRHSTALYQAIYTWAHNTGQVIVPDTGYTAEGAFRRIAHMLSSALRHGTFRHLKPHAINIPALSGIQGTPEAFDADLGLLAATEADLTLAKAPFLADIWGRHALDAALSDPSSDATRRIVAGLQEQAGALHRANRQNSGSRLRVGPSTAKRAFLARHRLSPHLRERAGRMDGDPGQRRGREPLLTDSSLYKGTSAVQDAAEQANQLFMSRKRVEISEADYQRVLKLHIDSDMRSSDYRTAAKEAGWTPLELFPLLRPSYERLWDEITNVEGWLEKIQTDRSMSRKDDMRAALMGMQTALQADYYAALIPGFESYRSTLGEAFKSNEAYVGNMQDFILYRGEPSFPGVKDYRVIHGEVSGVSKSEYPFIEATLTNGRKFITQIRISNHEQVSDRAPRTYAIDLRIPFRQKGERKQTYDRRITQEAAEQVEAKAKELWEAHAEIARKNAVPIAEDGALESNARIEGADAPTRAGGVRMTDRATEATSDSASNLPLSPEASSLFKATSAPQEAAPSPLARLGWNHLDRAASAKLAALARWTDGRTGLTQIVSKWTGRLPESIRQAAHSLKGQLFPDSILPREVAAARREMDIKAALGAQRGMDLMRALSGTPKFSDIAYPPEFAANPMWRRKLYAAMTGEEPMSALPPALQALGQRLRDMLLTIGREAVKQGRMSTDTFALLEESYMPHYYKEDVDREKSIFARFRLGLRDLLAQRTTAWHIVDKQQKDSTGQPALLNWQPGKWRFRNKEHRDAFYEDFLLQQSLARLQANSGRAARALTVADLRAPAKLDPVTRGRLQEIQRALRQRYQREAPLTIAEQEAAGLIMDPVYAIARYSAQMIHDNATAEFFNFVASKPEWVSDSPIEGFTEIPDNPRFGRLAGRHVQNDIAGQLLEMVEAPGTALQIYDTLLGWWKTGKTVLNPGTHVRNILGNLFFSQLAGNSVWNPGNLPYYQQAIRALREGGPALTEAYEAGILGADFVSAELRQHLKRLLPEPGTITPEAKTQDPGSAGRLLMGIGKAVSTYLADPSRKAFDGISALYQAEDEVFKLATYLKAKAMMAGDAAQAAAHVRQWFPFFDNGTSPTLKALGRTAMPFLGFYRESIRIFGHALKERPIALATGLSIPSLITFLSAAVLGLDDDELDQVRKDMRGRAGKLLGPTPVSGAPLFSMLLPLRSSQGALQQFDISAIHPFVDFLGNRVETDASEDWWQQTLRSLVAAGPIGSLLYSQMTGRDAFGDRTFVENNMTGGEKLVARLDNAAKTLLPPLAPGGTGFQTLLNAGERQANKTLEVRDPVQAVARAVGGLDVRNATPNLFRIADDWRKANGLPTEDGMDFSGSTPVSRGRKALFEQLAQPRPNLTAIRNIAARLKELGSPVETEQDINRLLFYRNPLMVIKGRENQQRFRASLTTLERQTLGASLQEYERIKARAPQLLRQAAQ